MFNDSSSIHPFGFFSCLFNVDMWDPIGYPSDGCSISSVNIIPELWFLGLDFSEVCGKYILIFLHDLLDSILLLISEVLSKNIRNFLILYFRLVIPS